MIEKLKSIVRRRLGLEKEEQKKEIRNYLRPYEKEPYPLRMLFDKSRVPKEYSERQWHNLENIYKILREDKEINEMIEKDRNLEGILLNVISNELDEVAAKAYEEEWTALSEEDIKKVVGASTPLPSSKKEARMPAEKANFINAEILKREAEENLRKQKELIVMDIGSGAGGTIIPFLRMLSEKERKKIQLILVDVMEKGHQVAVERILKERLLSEKQIHLIKENFFYLSKKAKEWKNKVDLVTSGAALHHTSNIKPVFKAIFDLLKDDGKLVFWDWGHSAWKAEKLIIAPQKARVDKFGQYYELDKKTVEAPKGTAFISRNTVKDVKERMPKSRRIFEYNTVLQMLSAWIGLLHYDERLKEKFVHDFKNAMKKGQEIDFVSWMKKNLLGVKPREEARIKIWEGHRPAELYFDALREAGFQGKPFLAYLVPESDLLYHIKIAKQELKKK